MEPDPTQPGRSGEHDDAPLPPPPGDDMVARARAQADAARRAIEAAEAARPDPPARIPGYEVLGEVHRGGQGVVYKAIQQTTRRKVAIKVMLQGAFAGPRDHARFEREVQVLAQIRDPGVVAIHDSGQADGHFYYVMDYIAGLPLDEHLAQRELNVRERLELFARVCRGVNAAHLRGIIHRDLKPSNIRIDADGNPHILDFGLAKVATGEMYGDRPQVMTMTGQFVGSLPWASPEQAEGVSERIDVRTDVYSLGVILYQMLTGDFPYEVRGSMREVLEHIVRSTPGRPSVKVKGLRDEVDWITLKALEKDRERRYQSAGELGRDVERYLRGEMIEARRDSATYMLRKALAQNKGLVGVVGAFVGLVAVFAVTASVLWGVAEDRRRDAESAEQDAEDARLLAEGRIETFRDVIRRANVDAGGDGEVTVRAVADELARSLDQPPADDPRGRALLRLDLAAMYESLGFRLPAEAQARLAQTELLTLLGESHPDTVRAMSLLSNILRFSDDPASRREARELTDRIVRTSGAVESMSERERANLAAALNNAARQSEQEGDHEAAEDQYVRAIAIFDELDAYRGTLTHAIIKANRAENLVSLGRADEAEALLRRLCDDAAGPLSASPSERGSFLKGHANALWALGRRDDACAQRRAAIAAYTDAQGPAGRDVALLSWKLIEWLEELGRLDESLTLAHALVDDLDAAFPHGHEHAARPAYYRAKLGQLLLRHGQPDAGADQLRAGCLALVWAPNGDGSVDRFRQALEEHYRSDGRDQEADAFLREIAQARADRDGARAATPAR